MSTTTNGITSNNDQAEIIDDLRHQCAELRADVDRLRDRVYDFNPIPEYDGLRIVGKLGLIEIGQIGENMFIQVTGRGECTGNDATIAVDDGRHSVPTQPTVFVSVSGRNGFVHHEATSLPMRPLGRRGSTGTAMRQR